MESDISQHKDCIHVNFANIRAIAMISMAIRDIRIPIHKFHRRYEKYAAQILRIAARYNNQTMSFK